MGDCVGDQGWEGDDAFDVGSNGDYLGSAARDQADGRCDSDRTDPCSMLSDPKPCRCMFIVASAGFWIDFKFALTTAEH